MTLIFGVFTEKNFTIPLFSGSVPDQCYLSVHLGIQSFRRFPQFGDVAVLSALLAAVVNNGTTNSLVGALIPFFAPPDRFSTPFNM